MKHKLIALIDQHEKSCFLVAINAFNPDKEIREYLKADMNQSRQILESYINKQRRVNDEI